MNEYRAWKRLRRKRCLRLLAVTLAFCLLFTTYPDILETLPVYAVGTQSGDSGESAQVMAETTTSGTCGATGNEGNVTWSYDTATKTLTISGSGAMAGCLNGTAPWNGFKGDITTAVINEGVTKIGSGAFWDCTNLKNVTIPNGVTTIDSWTFKNCTSLTSIVLPESATLLQGYVFQGCTNLNSISLPNVDTISCGLFQDCSSLTGITIPNTVESIQASAFQGCTKLKDITIPEDVTLITGSAFEGCTSLTSINIPRKVTTIYGSAFKGCTQLKTVTIEGASSIGDNAFNSCNKLESVEMNSVTSIGNSAFYGCANLTSAKMNSVQTIGNLAFFGCSKLASVEMESVQSIGSQAFEGCGTLGSITLPNTVTSIENNTFKNCIGLTSVTMNGDITKIGNSAFEGCTALTSTGITIPDTVTSIGEWAFAHCSKLTNETMNGVKTISARAFYNCTGLTTVSMDSATSIGASAFEGCTNLTGIKIPDNVTSIDSFAFSGCTGLTELTMPEGVKTIGNSAFSGCTGLTTVTIPVSVDSIDTSAFSGCTGLKKVEFKATADDGIPTLGTDVFKNCPLLTNNTDPDVGIKVPEGCVPAYESAWKETFPEFASTTKTHYHLPCGTTCSHKGDSHTGKVEYIPFPAPDETGAITLAANKNYYLTGDVKLSKTSLPDGSLPYVITIDTSSGSGTINICLNGYTITGENRGVINIIGNGADTTTVNICDCSEGKSGTIKVDKTGTETPNVINVTGATLNIYGGTIKCDGSAIYGVALHTNGALNMYGGKISTRAYPICVYENSPGTNINIYDGDIISYGASASAICTKSPSTIDISDGTIHSESYVAINTVDTNMTISGESKITNNSTGDFAIEYRKSTVDNPTLTISGNTTIKGRGCINIGGGTVNISGGTLESTGDKSNTINNAAGTLNITGGKVISKGTAINNYGTVTVEDTAEEGITSSGPYTLYNNAGATATISGGTIENTKVGNNTTTGRGTAIENLGTLKISDSAAVTSTGTDGIVIHNGNKDSKPKAILEITGGTFTSAKEGASYNLYNCEGSEITVSGGNFTSSNDNLDDCIDMLYNCNGAVAIISNITIKNCTGNTAPLVNFGKLTLNDVNVTSNSYAIQNGNGTQEATLNITGGTLSSSVFTTFLNYENATATISGTTIENTYDSSSSQAIENKGAITIKGEAKISSVKGKAIDNGTAGVDNSGVSVTIEGGTIKGAPHALVNYAGAAVTISGGKISNTYGNPCIDNSGTMEIKPGSSITSSDRPVTNGSKGTLTISGGTFTSTSKSGGDIRNYGTLKLSGNPTFTNTGIWLNGTTVINITGALNFNNTLCPIYVDDSSVTTDSPVTFTTDWSKFMSDKLPSDYFKSGLNYCTVDTKDNEGILRPSKVTFDLNYEDCTTITPGYVSSANMVAFPAAPAREGYVFGGWFNAKTGGTQFTSASTFDGDTTLYARWQECVAHTLANFSTPTKTQHTGVCTKCGLTVTENHKFTYSVGSPTIYEECDKGCSHSATATLTIPKNADLTYTGSAITPATITYRGDQWVGAKPTVEYRNNTNVGTATAEIWHGSIGGSTTFEIKPKSLTADMVTIDPTPYPHTGLALEPDVTVKDGETVLVEGTDYTVEYSNNTNPGKDATVTVTGQGNYTGTISKTFTIKQIETLPDDKPLENCVNIPTPSGSSEDNLYGDSITITPKDDWKVGTDPNNLGSSVTITEETGPDGKTIPIYLQDPNGNFYKTEFTYKLDKTAPTVSGNLTVEGANISFTPTESGKAYWIVSDTELTAEQVKQNGTALDITSGTAVNLAVTAAEKAQTVYVVLEDAAGNLSNVVKTEISAQAHTHILTKVERVEPTETTAGNVEYWHCSGCGKLYKDEQGQNETNRSEVTIPATGEGNVFSSVITSDSVKIVGYSGSDTAVEVPSVIDGKPVTAIGENAFAGKIEITSVTIPGSVTAIGKDAFSGCTGLTTIIIPKDLDTTSAGISDTVAKITYTVDENGGITITSVTPGTDSDGSKKPVTLPDTIGGKKPEISQDVKDTMKTIFHDHKGGTTTCTQKAVCEICGLEYGNFAGHMLAKTEGVEPTCTVDGRMACWTCTVCGKMFSDENGTAEVREEDVKIAALGHDWSGKWVVTKEPTATEEGVEETACTHDCGEKKQRIIPATGDGNVFSSVITSDGVKIVGYSGSDKVVEVPSEIEGRPVTAIGENVFAGHTEITSVTIPGSVTTIGENVFSGCTGLTTVIIPNGVDTTKAGVSDTVAKIIYAVDGNGNITINSVTPGSVTAVEVPSEIGDKPVTAIGEDAFAGCIGLTTITIPDSVTAIGKDAFSGCTGLTTITIPDSVTAIGENAFSGCTGLTTIIIPEGVDTTKAGIINTVAKITYKDENGKITITSVTPGTDSDGGKKPVTLPDTIGGQKPEISDTVKEEMKNISHDHKGGTATCIQKAVCEICGVEYGDFAGHTLVKTEGVEPTHTADGNMAYWTCSKCGKKFSDENGTTEITDPTTPATGHESPKSGDDSNPAFWILLMLMSMTALVGLFVKKRKTERHDER